MREDEKVEFDFHLLTNNSSNHLFIITVLNKKELKILFNKTNKLYNKNYVVYYIPYEKTKVKVSAKKKIGKAVVRNYEKRVVREILSKFIFQQNYFVIVICHCSFPKNYNFKIKKKNLTKMLAPLIESNVKLQSKYTMTSKD